MNSDRAGFGKTPYLSGLAFILVLAATAQSHANEADLRASISSSLVVPAERRFDHYQWEREPEIIALYFGADWCGPCHAFVPELKRIRTALKQAGANTEVVYVSLDESVGQMRRYMRYQQMPWPAIDYRRLRGMPAIRALAGPAPPNLVLIGPDGNVLASGWHGRHYLGLKPVMETWTRALAAQHNAASSDSGVPYANAPNPHATLNAAWPVAMRGSPRAIGTPAPSLTATASPGSKRLWR